MTDYPRISIVVLTYNSAAFVESTLESIYRQDYKGELELIIGDDCSQDDTARICEKWVNEHCDRFARCEIIKNAENQGVVANINTCYKACRGAWIKDIAGDDILMDNALSTLYTAAITHDVSFVYSALRMFEKEDELKSPEKLPYSLGGPGDAFVDLAYIYRKPNFWLNAPTFLISSDLLKKIGYVPTMFRNIEDRPLFAKTLASGYKIWHTAEPTVFYRNNPLSISNTAGGYRFAECNWRVYREIIRPIFSPVRVIDMDLRMLPQWLLSQTKQKSWAFRLFRLCMQLSWIIWRACTFYASSSKLYTKKSI